VPEARTRLSSRAELQRELIDLVSLRLSSRRRRAGVAHVTGDTHLFDSGLVDSLAILELVAFVEAATGRPIPARQVVMKHFATIDRICEAFWRDEGEVAHGCR